MLCALAEYSYSKRCNKFDECDNEAGDERRFL